MLKPIKKLLEGNILLIAIFITLAIAVLSFISIKGLNPIDVENSDKIGHWIAYFCLGFTWFLYAQLNHYKLPLFFMVLVSYGIIIEVFQGAFTKNREFDFFDMLANTLGLGIAWVLVSLTYKKT